MTNSTQVLKPNATEQVMHVLAIALAGAGLICSGWFGNLLWNQNELKERAAQFDAYKIELQQWATQAANTEFAAKRQALVDELYKSCVVPPGTVQFGSAATFQFGREKSGVLIDGTCYVPASSGYPVENQVKAQIPAPPEPQ